MFRVITDKGIEITEIDAARFAKDKFLFNITHIPHDETRPHQIRLLVNGESKSFEPEDGWTSVSFEARHGWNKIIFENLGSRPVKYERFIRYKVVHREGKTKRLDYYTEHAR
jgi:hypothetical protein